jgi:hypothetical protein
MAELVSTVDGDNYIDEGIKKHFKILSPRKDKFTFSDQQQRQKDRQM